MLLVLIGDERESKLVQEGGIRSIEPGLVRTLRVSAGVKKCSTVGINVIGGQAEVVVCIFEEL